MQTLGRWGGDLKWVSAPGDWGPCEGLGSSECRPRRHVRRGSSEVSSPFLCRCTAQGVAYGKYLSCVSTPQVVSTPSLGFWVEDGLE